MSEIISADSDRDGFWGRIRTEIFEIEWSYESYQQCCESFGTIMSQPISWLNDRKFTNISLDTNTGYESNSAILTVKLETDEELNKDKLQESICEFLDKYGNMIPKDDFKEDLIKFCENLFCDTWTIEFYNRHNGYYTHNLDVKIDGQTKWNLSL
jgi:hypothetical protein